MTMQCHISHITVADVIRKMRAEKGSGTCEDCWCWTDGAIKWKDRSSHSAKCMSVNRKCQMYVSE